MYICSVTQKSKYDEKDIHLFNPMHFRILFRRTGFGVYYPKQPIGIPPADTAMEKLLG